MKPTIPVCDSGENPDAMYDLLSEAGCLVVTGMAEQTTIDLVKSELADYMQEAESEEDDPENFYPGKTQIGRASCRERV